MKMILDLGLWSERDKLLEYNLMVELKIKLKT